MIDVNVTPDEVVHPDRAILFATSEGWGLNGLPGPTGIVGVKQMSDTSSTKYQGNDKLLFGIILGVLAFWLFAQTTLNISPTMAADLGLEQSVMNIAVSITALFSGIFIVVMGGLADRIGRVKVVLWGC